MVSSLELWLSLLGSGVVTGVVGWIFGGKQAKKIEIKKANGDAVATMQSVYDQFLSDYKDRMGEVMADLNFVKDHNRELQTQFNKIQLDYAKEVERSQNWEKLHRELTAKYAVLERDYDELKGLYEKLKADFDKHKKLSK
jgi:hypothetical protein